MLCVVSEEWFVVSEESWRMGVPADLCVLPRPKHALGKHAQLKDEHDDTSRSIATVDAPNALRSKHISPLRVAQATVIQFPEQFYHLSRILPPL